MNTIEVRGHSRFERRAPMYLRFLAAVVDLGLGILLLELFYVVFSIDPSIDWKLAPILSGCVLLPWLAGKRFIGTSPGEWTWKIRSEKTKLRELEDDIRGGLLTLTLILAGIFVFTAKIATHPYWSHDKAIKIATKIPPADWRVLAFYYTLAPWPSEVQGHPVFYSVPYEVGPPTRFIGHVESDWIRDSVRVSFEGPKTPFQYQSRVRDRKSVRECFSKSPMLEPGCVDVRRLTLQRHLKELRALGYAQFKTMWFSAENPAIPEDQQAQGVLLRATADDKVQERYILITPQGIHQSIAISYLQNEEGLAAKGAFETALGALRISEDLNQGRAWVNNLLEHTRLRNLPDASSSGYLNGISEVQSLLVSKLTVSPAAWEAYFHLAGMNLLLLRYCVKNHDPDLRSFAQAMVERMDHFAHDVNPKNPKLGELDRLLRSAKQF